MSATSAEIPKCCHECRCNPREMLLCNRLVEELTPQQAENPDLPCNKETMYIGNLDDVIPDPLSFNNRGGDEPNPGWKFGTLIK